MLEQQQQLELVLGLVQGSQEHLLVQLILLELQESMAQRMGQLVDLSLKLQQRLAEQSLGLEQQ